MRFQLLMSSLLLTVISASIPAQTTNYPLIAESFPGSDLGAQIAAADASLGSATGTIAIDQPGTITTTVVLSANRGLVFNAPVTVSTPITLSSYNSVSCLGGGASISSSLSSGGIFQANSGSTNVEIKGCTFTSSHATVLATSTPISNITIRNNMTQNTALFSQNLSSGSAASSNVFILGNDASITSEYQYSSVFVVGPFQHFIIQNNHFEGGGGVVLFGADAASYPTLSQVIAANGGNSTLTGNTCRNVVFCLFGSTVYKVVMSSNVADGCSDVCFDAEGSADVEMIGNVAQGSANGDFTFFFSSYYNSVVGNTGISTGEPLVALYNASQLVINHQNLKVANNQFTCNTSAPCTWVNLQNNMNTDIEGNTVKNGVLGLAGYSTSLTVRNNRISFDIATSAGLSIPSTLMNAAGPSSDIVSDNIIETDLPGGQALGVSCLAQTQTDYNATDTTYFLNNQCIGQWAGAATLVAATSNPGTGANWIVRGNTLPTLTLNVSGTNANYFEQGNCVQNSIVCD